MAGEDLTAYSLSGSKVKTDSYSQIVGRTLMAQAHLALKNSKKAHAYALEYLLEKPDYNYPSGGDENAMDDYILKKMFTDEYDEDTEYDPEWIFPGWMGFKCFGIKAPKDYQMKLLTLEDIHVDEKKSGSRRHARSEKKKEEDAKREMANTKRGIAHGATQKDLAVISQKEEDQKQRETEKNVYVLTTMITSVQKDIQFAFNMLQLEDKGSIEFDLGKDEISNLRHKLKELQSDLEALAKIKRQTPHQVANILGVKRSNTAISTHGSESSSTNFHSPLNDTVFNEDLDHNFHSPLNNTDYNEDLAPSQLDLEFNTPH